MDEEAGATSNSKVSQSQTIIIPTSSVDLKPLISKLGHNLDEIRIRSLKNILFKLDHHLICAADVVQEKQLITKLLEWFNFPKCPLQKEVLGLLEIIAKHSDGARTLLGIGAVEFLSHLRQDVEPELYQMIDNVIHQLLSLPGAESQAHQQWCLYNTPDKKHSTVQQQPLTDTGNDLTHEHFQSQAMPTPQTCRPSVSQLSVGSSRGYFSEHQRGQTAFKMTSSEGYFNECQHGQTTSKTSSSRGYFSEQQNQHLISQRLKPVPHSSLAASKQELFLSQSTSLAFFQWLPLSAGDRHILSATNCRLQSQNLSLVSKSCEFLRNVLFKDFPAEIFLQRPTVFKSLLQLLDEKVEDGLCIPLFAIDCLGDLCSRIHKRLQAASDIALHCPDPECWKYRHISVSVDAEDEQGEADEEQVGSARQSGDGGVASDSGSSSSAASGEEDEEVEDCLVTEALQFNQLSVQEFCTSVLSKTMPVIGGPLASDGYMMIAVVKLLHRVLTLMQDVLPDDVWVENSVANTVMAPLLRSCLRLLGEGMMYHLKHTKYKDGEGARNEATSTDQPTHWMTAINLAVFTAKFLHVAVPLELANQVVPAEFVTVIWLLVMDGVMAQTHPAVRASLLRYLEVLDRNSHLIYLSAARVAQSLADTCCFLRACRDKGSHSLSALLELAERSIPSLQYHRHEDFVPEAVGLCSSAMKQGLNNPVHIRSCSEILLKLLAFPIATIRQQAYRTCLRVTKTALKVSHVTNPMSTASQGAAFIVEPTILYQMCAFGLYDDDKKVEELAVDLLTTLLLGRMSMNCHLWKQLLHAIIPSLPFLQACTGSDPTLDQCVVELMEAGGPGDNTFTADGDVVTLPMMERFRIALRMMFVKNVQLRTRGLAAVTWYLTQEQKDVGQRRLFSNTPPDNLQDLFIVNQVTSSVHAHEPVSHSNFDKSEVLKLFSIFNDPTMDYKLRKSSAEQLAIILQDPNWHSMLLEEGTDEVALGILKEVLQQDPQTKSNSGACSESELIAPCLAVLRLLVEYNRPCRHKLAQRLSVYSVVSRSVLQCSSSGGTKYEGSSLLVLLLFDETAATVANDTSSAPFSLPDVLVKRYHLPFNPHICSVTNPYSLAVPSDHDPLASEPVVSMLRVAWNLAWQGDVGSLERIQGARKEQATSSSRFAGALQWTEVDSELLRTSDLVFAVPHQLERLTSATSHYAVKIALLRLMEHLLTDRGLADQLAKSSLDTLYSVKWETAFERYLKVVPSTSQDDSLLVETLGVLSTLLTHHQHPPEPVVAWIARTVIHNDSPIMLLLKVLPTNNLRATEVVADQLTESKRLLRMAVLRFLIVLVKVLSKHTTLWKLSGERLFIGDLVYVVTLNLDLADNPQFYDLPMLESSLECLAHITAQPRWSMYCKAKDGLALCRDLLTSLIQVVSAFHTGHLDASMSFMGKGVTYHASLCLVHLTHEFACLDLTEEWPSHWVADSKTEEFPLAWLVPLWTDRSPEVRWLGMYLATSLTRSYASRAALGLACRSLVGGVWSLALSVLLDDKECGMVRQQAAQLLRGLTSGLVRSNEETQSDEHQEELLLHGVKGSETVSGIPAVVALLEHYQFYKKITTLLSTSTSGLPSRTTSRACQSSASISRSVSNASDIPYNPLTSSSQSVSLGSQNAVGSPEPNESPNPQAKPLVNGSTNSSNGTRPQSRVSQSTVVSQTPTSLVPLINERGLPSGMSEASSSNTWSGSRAHSVLSSDGDLVPAVTPGLVGGVAALLHNLLLFTPEHTGPAMKKGNLLALILRHLDSSELQSLICAQRERSDGLRKSSGVIISDVLLMYTNIISFVHSLVRLDHSALYDLQQDTDTLQAFVLLFSLNLSYLGVVMQQRCNALLEALVSFLLTLLQQQGPLTVPSLVENTIYQHWICFTSVFSYCLKTASVPSSLRVSSLKLLSSLLAAEGKRNSKKSSERTHKQECLPSARSSKLSMLLDKSLGQESENEQEKQKLKSQGLQGEALLIKTRCESEPVTFVASGNSDAKRGTAGVDAPCLCGDGLCTVLLAAYDGVQLGSKDVSGLEKSCVVSALSSLLAVSHSAKHTALQAGLLESSLECIKQLHVQLNLSSLQVGKGTTTKRKEDPILSEFAAVLSLLRNFVFNCPQVKIACVESGLVDVLQRLWAWCTVDEALRHAVLSILSTLTSNCAKASYHLAFGSTPSGTTLMQNIIKFTNKVDSKVKNSSSVELEKNLVTHKALFALLANLALSPECRGVLWKSNFLSQFSKLQPVKGAQTRPNSRSVARTVAGSWLNLLVNLSFFPDGQQMVLKTPQAVNLLLEQAAVEGARQMQEKALLVLRNLCCHNGNKALILTKDDLLQHLIQSVESDSVHVRSLAVSALWALLFNCHKAKVILKNAGLPLKIEELKLQPDSRWTRCCETHQLTFADGLDRLKKLLS